MKKIDKAKPGKEKLLDILVGIRTVKALDIVLNNDNTYQSALLQQSQAFSKMERIGLSRKQQLVIDDVISTINYCAAVYGTIAYRFGLQDGIRLTSEMEESE